MLDITFILLFIASFIFAFWFGHNKKQEYYEEKLNSRKYFPCSTFMLFLDEELSNIYSKCFKEFRNEYKPDADTVTITLKLEEYREVELLLSLMTQQAVFPYNDGVIFVLSEFTLKDKCNKVYELTFTRIEDFKIVISCIKK